MTKASLIELIYSKIGLAKREATELVELVFDLLKETLIQGEKIKISGFGNFTVRNKRPRRGRNPQTGEAIEITARRVLSFRPSPILRQEVNAGSSSA